MHRNVSTAKQMDCFAIFAVLREFLRMLYAFDSSRNCVVFAYPNICKRTAFLCPKASETAWILKSNRSLGRVQKQKNRLRFPSESVFCSRKRFFVGKNAPKIFWNAPAFKTKKNRRTCEDIRKIRRFVLPLDFSSVYELKNHFPIMEHRHFFYRCSPQLLIKAVQHLRNSRDGFQEVM